MNLLFEDEMDSVSYAFVNALARPEPCAQRTIATMQNLPNCDCPLLRGLTRSGSRYENDIN